MVAPFVVAGLGALAGVVGGAIASALGRKETRYAVVRFSGGQVVGRPFGDFESAKQYQDELARQGHASIVVQKVKGPGGEYSCLHPVRGMTDRGRPVPGEAIRRMRREGPPAHARARGYRMKDIEDYEGLGLGVGARDFDTLEEQEKVSLLTTRFPTSRRSQVERFGPYPADYIKPDETMKPILPLYRDTTSSHEWKTDVDTWEVPGKFFPGHRAESQPEMLTVYHTPQYPEPRTPQEAAAVPAEPSISPEARHGHQVRRAAHEAPKGRAHGEAVREAARKVRDAMRRG